MRRSRRGDDREVKVGQWLEEHGYVVGSRRHIGGAGDLLAVRCWDESWSRDLVPVFGWTNALLIEVKSTAAGPYAHFGRADRIAMRMTATRIGAGAFLAWWPPGGKLQWIGSSQWPAERKAT